MKAVRRRPNRSARRLGLPALVLASLMSAGAASAADVTVGNELDLRQNLGGTGKVATGETITVGNDIAMSAGSKQMDVKLQSLTLTGSVDDPAKITAGVTIIMKAVADKKGRALRR